MAGIDGINMKHYTGDSGKKAFYIGCSINIRCRLEGKVYRFSRFVRDQYGLDAPHPLLVLVHGINSPFGGEIDTQRINNKPLNKSGRKIISGVPEMYRAGFFMDSDVCFPIDKKRVFIDKYGKLRSKFSFGTVRILSQKNGKRYIRWGLSSDGIRAKSGRVVDCSYVRRKDCIYVMAKVKKGETDLIPRNKCKPFPINGKLAKLSRDTIAWNFSSDVNMKTLVKRARRSAIGLYLKDEGVEMPDKKKGARKRTGFTGRSNDTTLQTTITRSRALRGLSSLNGFSNYEFNDYMKEVTSKEELDEYLAKATRYNLEHYISQCKQRLIKECTPWYNHNEIAVVMDIDGYPILAEEALCLVDSKGHKKYVKSSNVNVFDLAGMISTMTTLNLDNGGRKLVFDELDYFKAYIKPSSIVNETTYLGHRIAYHNDKDLDQAKRILDEYAKNPNFSNTKGLLHPNASNLSGGRIAVFQPFTLAKKSMSTLKTGRIGYSFGVEFETSGGDLSDDKCKILSLSKQGDASIDANEFVTRPLHGDNGIDMIRTYTDVLSQSCIITDRDSIHIHVGGAEGIDTPIYNQFFSVNAIRLGEQIEDELFAIVPPHRRTSKYCKKVSDFFEDFPAAQSSKDRELLYSYVFQRNGTFDRTWNRKRSDMSKWCNGRYKWLNLVNCNTVNGYARQQSFKTVEFRLWPGTLDFDEVKRYIQLSLAFVWFVENRPRRIKEGNVSLGEVVDTAIRNDAESLPLIDFIEEKSRQYSPVKS